MIIVNVCALKIRMTRVSKNGTFSIFVLFLFWKLDFTFSHVFQNQNFEPIQSGLDYLATQIISIQNLNCPKTDMIFIPAFRFPMVTVRTSSNFGGLLYCRIFTSKILSRFQISVWNPTSHSRQYTMHDIPPRAVSSGFCFSML